MLFKIDEDMRARNIISAGFRYIFVSHLIITMQSM